MLEFCLFSAVEGAGPRHRDTRSTAQGPSEQGPPSLPLLFLVLPVAGLGSFSKFQGFGMEGASPRRALLIPTHPLHLPHSCIISTSPGELNFFSKKYLS